MGTGFIVGTHTVITAAHLVADASVVTVRLFNGSLTKAEVVALDEGHDAAVLWIADMLSEPLTLVDQPPKTGADVGVLGYPLASQAIQFTQGTISGGHDPVTYENGQTVDGLYVTTAAINPGNSGGPVFLMSGDVVGLVSGNRSYVGQSQVAQGQNYFESSQNLADVLNGWSGSVDPLNDACGTTRSGDGGLLQLKVSTSDEGATDVGQVLYSHGSAINSGQYEAAYSLFSANEKQTVGSVEHWSAGLGSTTWQMVELDAVTGANSARFADVRLTTHQSAADGFQGQTCSLWTLRYGMTLDVAGWLIDSVRSLKAPTSC
jgi:hypothetical protein